MIRSKRVVIAVAAGAFALIGAVVAIQPADAATNTVPRAVVTTDPLQAQKDAAQASKANCLLLAAHSTGSQLKRAQDCITDQNAIIKLLMKATPSPSPTVTTPPTTVPPTTTPPTTVPPTTVPPTTVPPTTPPPTTTPPTTGVTSFLNGPGAGVGPASSPTHSISTALQSNTVYDGYAITNNGQVSANNITLKNCTFVGGPTFSGNNVTVDHCKFTGGVSFSGSQFVTFTANEIVQWNGDGLHITSDSGPASDYVVSDNWIHNVGHPACADHTDAIQILGLTRGSFTGNVVDSGPWQSCGSDPGDGPLNGTQISTEQGNNDQITYDNNLFNGGGILVRVYNLGSTNVHIVNNKFGNDFQFSEGDTLNSGARAVGPGFEWSGNTNFYSGAAVARS